MSTFQLFTLGQLRLVDSEGVEHLRGRRKELVLLAFLARRAPRAAPREELTALLWGDRDDDRARHSLRQTLLRVRQALGPALEVDASRVRLAADAVAIDASTFEADVSNSRYRDAVDRWHGDFLQDADDVGSPSCTSWIEAERESVRRRLEFALGKLLDQAEADRAWQDAIALAERLVALRPLDAPARTRLIRALKFSGRLSDALARHAAALTAFRAETDDDPPPELVRLGAELETVASRVSAGSRALLTPDLVGRDDVLAALVTLWKGIAARPAIVLVEGDAGIGKTRLVAEVVRRARVETPGVVVLECRAVDADRDAPWATARRLLAPLTRAARLADVSNRALGEVSTLVPALRERFPNLAPAAVDDHRLLESVREVLRAVAERSPILLVIDDASHADARSTEMVLALLRRPAPGLLAILSERSEALAQSPLAAEVVRIPDARRVRLQPLSPTETETLIGSMLELSGADRLMLTHRLHAESAGNPFYVTELVSALADTGLLSLTPNGTWALTPDIAGRPLPLPRGVRGAIAQRLDRLDADARLVLETCALAGRIESSALQAAAELPEGRFTSAVETLVARRLLRASPDAPTSYEPTHELLRRITCELATTNGSAALPRHRFWLRHAWAVAAASLIALVGAGALWRSARSARVDVAADRVLVAPFANETGDASFDRLSDIVADWLAQGIARTGLVKVVPLVLTTDEVARASGNAQTLARVRARALDARAGIVVWGRLVRAGDALRLQASITDSKSGELLQSVPVVTGPASTPLVAVEALRRATLAALAPLVDQRMTTWARVASTPPSYEAYLAFAEGLDAFARGAPNHGALQPLLRAYAIDTTFTLPLLYAAWTLTGAGDQTHGDSILRLLAPRREMLAPFDRALLDFLRAAHERDRTASYTAALAVADIAPQSEIAAVELPFAAMAINRPHRAREILERVDPNGSVVHGNSGYWTAYSHALHMTGDFDRQLALARTLRRRDPRERAALSYETRALAALGRTAELHRVLEEAIAFPVDPLWGAPGLRVYIVASDELRAHGHAAAADSVLTRAVRVYERAPDDVRGIPKQRFEMARALYRLGRLDEAKAIFGPLVATNALAPLGDYAIEARAHLGFIAARVGDTATVAAVDRWLRDLRGPFLLGQNTELRAALHALLGQRDEAVRLLHQAVAEGRFFDVGKHTYFEYQGLRGYQPFEEWLAPKG